MQKSEFKPNHFLQGKVNRGTELQSINFNIEFANQKEEKEWFNEHVINGKYCNRTLVMLIDEPVSEGSEKVLLKSIVVM